MLKIRLKRVGAKKQPYYRIVVMPARSSRDGQAIARVGTVDPRKNPPDYTVDNEAAMQWLDRGAQPTDVVASIFRKTGVMQQWRAKKAEAKKSKTPKEAQPSV
jgi:small subunit ribosomal protein S16